MVDPRMKQIAFLVRKSFMRRGQLSVRILRILGSKISGNVTFQAPVTVLGSPSNLRIGTGTVCNEFSVLNCRQQVEIGEDCHLSSGVKVMSLALDDSRQNHKASPIRIGDRVWLAAGVVVGPGVKICSDVIVGANSVVTRDIDSPGLYAGAPAKFVRNLSLNDAREQVERID